MPTRCSTATRSRAMRDAFADDRDLVAATGILLPVCDASLGGRLFEWFQTYEYLRNFLSRYAWSRMDSLLLISGAFAGFRRAPLIEVGGFDLDCLVEDYELIHRLKRHGVLTGRPWTTAVLGVRPCPHGGAGDARGLPAAAPPLVRRLPADPDVVSRHDRQPALRAARPRHAARQGGRHAPADLWPDGRGPADRTISRPAASPSPSPSRA